MSLRISCGAALLFALASSTVLAQESPYISASLVAVGVDEENWASTNAVPAVRFMVGTDIYRWLGAEAHLLVGVGKADGDLTEAARQVVAGVDYKLRYGYSLFIKPKLDLSESVSLHALLGYSLYQLDASSYGGAFGGSSSVGSDSMASYGAGMAFGNKKHMQLLADYIVSPGFEPSGFSNTDISTISLGIRYPLK